MIEKTIKQVLSGKINNWIESIDDINVQAAVRKDVIVTGGCFTSFLQNQEPNDYDCYFRTKETVLLVAGHYAKKWNERNRKQENAIHRKCNVMVLDCDDPSREILDYYKVEDIADSEAVMLSNFDEGRVKMIFPSDGVVSDSKHKFNTGGANEIISEIDDIEAAKIIKKEKEKYYPVFISSNAITLSSGIQIVVRFYGEPDQIHDTFDFDHTKAYFDNKDCVVNIPKDVYECVINKTLRYTGSKYPVCSIFRIRKFIERGWTINAGQMLKIAMQISELDLMDINVLEDQLIGVDSLYFMQLIEQFRAQKENNKDFQLSVGYVVSIVDKIF